MRSCYVSMPFGQKPDLAGRVRDFDHLFREVIRPAVQALSIECSRLDDFSSGAILQKTMFTALLSSDLVIADISTHHADVFYELGVRHALRRGRTILISDGVSRLPFDISYVQTLRYEPDASGRVTGEAAERFRESLQAIIRQSERTTVSDSPIYEYFSDLQVTLPADLKLVYRQRRRRTRAKRGFEQAVIESPARAISELRKSEEEVRRDAEADPIEYLTLLEQYRDV